MVRMRGMKIMMVMQRLVRDDEHGVKKEYLGRAHIVTIPVHSFQGTLPYSQQHPQIACNLVDESSGNSNGEDHANNLQFASSPGVL